MRVHRPDRFMNRRELPNPVDAIVVEPSVAPSIDKRDGSRSVIYVTASKTFDGPAVFVTLSDDSPPPKATKSDSNDDEKPKTSVVKPTPKPTRASTTPAASTLPKPTTAEKKTSSSDDDNKAKTTESTSSSSQASQTSTDDSQSPTETPSESTSNPTTSGDSSGTAAQTGALGRPTSVPSSPAVNNGSGGMSGGAKAGIAIGVLAIIGLLIGALIFLHRKKQEKKAALAMQEELGNKKSPGFGAGSAMVSEKPTPITPTPRHMHNFSTQSAGGPFVGAGAARSQSRPGTSASNRADNPFGNYAERAENTPSIASTPILPPVVHGSPLPFHQSSPSTSLAVPVMGPDTANSSMISDSNINASGVSFVPPASSSPPPIPPVLAMPMPSVPLPIADPISEMPADVPVGVPLAGVGGVRPAPAPVHRVQMDFNPSMPDELALRLGHTVRLIREYDDGWALCELIVAGPNPPQGVVPRTCLSEKPIPPRRPSPAGHGSPPRPPRPDEPQSISSTSLDNRIPDGSASQSTVSLVGPQPSMPPPFAPSQSSVDRDQSQLTFPQPPSILQSARAVSPASFTISTHNSRPGSPVRSQDMPPQVDVPTLPPLNLEMDLSDEGLLGSTSISLSDDGNKLSEFIASSQIQPPVPAVPAQPQHLVEAPEGLATTAPEAISALPPPPLFSSHPRSLSPGPGAMKQSPNMSSASLVQPTSTQPSRAPLSNVNGNASSII